MDLGHQDWKPVIIRKNKLHKHTDQPDGGGKKKQPGNSLDENKDEFKNKKISKELSTDIIKRRCNLKMNQKLLASLVHIKVELLQKYENGQAIIEPRILHKIKKTLKMI